MQLFNTIRDNFTFSKSDSGSFGPFSASYSVAMHLEGGSIQLNNDDTVEVKHLQIVWDTLKVQVCFNLPGFCIGGWCIVPDPWNGCLVGVPKICIGGPICVPLDLSGLVSEVNDLKANLSPVYFVDPARTASESDLDAEFAGHPNKWRIFLDPIFVHVDPIDIPASIANIIENIVKDAIENMFPSTSGITSWTRCWPPSGPILDLVKSLLGIVGAINDWLTDLLMNTFDLLGIIESGDCGLLRIADANLRVRRSLSDTGCGCGSDSGKDSDSEPGVPCGRAGDDCHGRRGLRRRKEPEYHDNKIENDTRSEPVHADPGLDSGSLTMLGTIVHQLGEPGEYRGALHHGADVKAVFYIAADSNSPVAQVTVDLGGLDQAQSGAASAAAEGTCGCEGGSKDNSGGKRYTVNPRGYVLFHVQSGGGGYYVHLRRVDAAETDKGYDTRTLKNGDAFTGMILRPGTYSIVNTLTKAKTEAVVQYPKIGDKPYVPPAPVRIGVHGQRVRYERTNRARRRTGPGLSGSRGFADRNQTGETR